MKATACALFLCLVLTSLPSASADGPCDDPLAVEPCFACIGIYAVPEGLSNLPVGAWVNKQIDGSPHTGIIMAESGDGELDGDHGSVYFVGVMMNFDICPPKVSSPGPTAIYWLWMVERLIDVQVPG